MSLAYPVLSLVVPLLDLKAVPGVASDGAEVRVDFLVSITVDGHGCTEISVGVPRHHSRHPLTLVTAPVISILTKKNALSNFDTFRVTL